MGRITIEKNTVQETLIIPLYARKLGNELFPHILLDPYADDVIRHLNYDFSTLDKKEKVLFVWKFWCLRRYSSKQKLFFMRCKTIYLPIQMRLL